MRIFASVTAVALLSAATASALADQFDWGPLTSRPRNDQSTTWDAHCNDGSERVVSGQCTISAGGGTLQSVGVNDERDTWRARFAQNDFARSPQTESIRSAFDPFGRTKVRHPANTIEDMKKVLLGYRDNMRVEIGSDVPVSAKTVADLRALPTWQDGLVLDIHVDLDPRLSVVRVERAS